MKAAHINGCNVYLSGVDGNFEAMGKMIEKCIKSEDGCLYEIFIIPSIEEKQLWP